MDLKNFFKFRKEIKREINEPKSGMNSLGIHRNWLGNILYVQINCTEANLRDADYNYDRMIMTKLKPIVHYLSQDLGWSDYLVPQVNNFVDEDGNQTLSYGVLFIFTGYSLTMTKAILGIIAGIVGIGSLIYCLMQWLLQ